MNSDAAIEHQRRRLFVAQLLSFAGLFIALGLIVFVMYERSVYRDVDQTLVQQKRKSLSDKQTGITIGRNPVAQWQTDWQRTQPDAHDVVGVQQ
jgi:two-component system sensor histidine kinase CiaH